MITFYFYFQETYNSRLRERYGDDPLTHPEFDLNLLMEVGSSGGPDKNQVYRLFSTTVENLRVTCSVPTVGSSQLLSSTQSKEFVVLQQHTAQLTEKYDHLSAEYAQLKAEYAQHKVDHEQLREMVMNIASQSSDTCAPHPFWTYNHQPPTPPPPPTLPLY